MISPASTINPVVSSVSHATRLVGSSANTASSMASETWSAILSRMPFGYRLGRKQVSACAAHKRETPSCMILRNVFWPCGQDGCSINSAGQPRSDKRSRGLLGWSIGRIVLRSYTGDGQPLWSGVELIIHGLQSSLENMGIDLRRREIGMTKQGLNRPQVRPTIQEMGCERMSDNVGAKVPWETRAHRVFLEDLPKSHPTQVTAAGIDE